MGSIKRMFRMAVLVLVMLVLQSTSAFSQTAAEFLRQKATQKKYLLQQIAGLQVYIGYAQKGYKIVGDGLSLVQDFTSGEFKLHKNYFESLSAVNPLVKKSEVVVDFMDYQLGVLRLLGAWKAEGLNANEWGYVAGIKTNLILDCAVELEEFLVVVTASKLEMTDEQRLARLDGLLFSMRDRYEFVCSFSADLRMLIRQKKKEQRSVDQIRRLYEIN